MQIACVGHASIDHVFQIDEFPHLPTKTPAHDFQSVGGGMAANAALVAARLGVRVIFVGAVGDDDAVRLVRQQLAGEGIALQHLQKIAGARRSRLALQSVGSTGAGDVFHAALTLALARKQPTARAFAYASAAAALKCTRAGGVRGAPHAQEVAESLRLHAHGRLGREQAWP